MSDNTAKAHEPSMEDILASIRRIIDEEDTRDGRPASESSFDDNAQADEVDTTMPVMAPDVASRDQASSDSVADDDAEPSDESESIFPERESLFWSRATGRGADSSGASDDDTDETTDGPSGGIVAGAAVAAGAGVAAVGSSATDIFTRAQNKLGSTTSRVGSTRERMQSLAARSASRAEEAADDAMDSGADIAELDPIADLGDLADDALPDFSAIEDDDTPDVLELTDAVEGSDIPETSEIDSLISESGAEAEAETGATAGIADLDDDGDVEDYATAFESVAPVQAVESAVEKVASADDVVSDAIAENDVLDLTTPLGSGRVETQVDDVVAAVDEPEEAVAEISDGLPEIEPGERLEDDYSARFYGDNETLEADVPTSDALDESEVSSDAYAESDDDESAYAGSLMTGETYEVSEVSEAEVADVSDDDGVDADEEETASWGAGLGAAAAATAGVATGAATNFYGSKDDDDDLQDERETDEPLGFSDTFSASDVYHDEPPALDEDYSASLDREEEPVVARSGFAGEDAFGDDPSDAAYLDDEMDTVGGLVRDAMERDPVDYADPSALVSMSSEEISARALASLADVEGEASRRMYGALRISEGGESESIEGMVKGMLRPMLREWLDDNLPNMVETMVRGEVERISAKSRQYSRAADDD